MLGKERPNRPIVGKYAKKIREKLREVYGTDIPINHYDEKIENY